MYVLIYNCTASVTSGVVNDYLSGEHEFISVFPKLSFSLVSFCLFHFIHCIVCLLRFYFYFIHCIVCLLRFFTHLLSSNVSFNTKH